MKKLFAVIMLISVLSVIPLFGQETKETSEAEEIQGTLEIEEEQEANEVQETQEEPKEIEFNKSLFTSFKYNDGETTRKLNLGELEEIIVSINDEEATQHFIKSKTLKNVSFPFEAVGGFLIGWPIGGVISGKEFDTRIFAAGCGITTIGLVLVIFSQKERIKSVKRYNKVVKEEWGFHFQYVPENSELGLKIGYSF